MGLLISVFVAYDVTVTGTVVVAAVGPIVVVDMMVLYFDLFERCAT